ncbi:RHS repeat domain-containing protein [Bdellovibrio bacteriovorus]|uniref:Teneurin-like YD-shell domain-containing protein n=1 Tax=Bdellovibrio bacteriovorus str. Tiberius TaxID=1069642 RepID=K7YWA0_BDEBC|nr:RHS repeat domain-containing protein [Bdellovibrio bacteriovorus]AFY00970.1 Hypothetical protein Bdt_1271 [Bdellovibrio bacteriovorus str. Tiberius]
MRAVFVLAVLTNIFCVRNVSAQTCEETRAVTLKGTIDSCGPNKCDYFQYETICWSYRTTLKSISAGGLTGVEGICGQTVVQDKFYPDSPPWHSSDYSEASWGIVYDCEKMIVNPPASGGGAGGGSGGPPGGCPIDGSIVYAEDGTLTEEVGVVGGMSLAYHSGFQAGKNGDFELEVVLSGASVRDHITSFSLETRRSGVLVDTASFLNNVVNQSYTYIWDGLDTLGSEKALSAEFEVKLTENSPTGSFTSIIQKTLGHLDAKGYGLGGWLPKQLKVYDAATKRLYNAMGGYVNVEAKPYGTSGNVMVADGDGHEVYIFDGSGRHLSTKTSLTGSNKYTFTYDLQKRLTEISEPFGRVIAFNRNSSGDLLSITAPNGQITSIALDVNGYVSSFANPGGEVFSVTYFGTKGLLHTFQKPNGEVSTFEYSSKGVVTKDTHSGGYFFELVRNLNSSYSFDVNVVSAEGRVAQIISSLSEDGAVNRTSTAPSGVVQTSSYSQSSGAYYRNDIYHGVNHSISSIDDQRFGNMVRFPQSVSTVFNGGSSRTLEQSQNVTLSDPNDPFSILTWQECS